MRIRMRQVRSLLGAVLFSLCLAEVRADPGWLLTTVDFKQRPVSLEAIDANGIKFGPVDGSGTTTLSYSDFLQIDRVSTPRQSSARFMFMLANGDHLAGDPLLVKDEQLTVANATIGELRVALKD